MKSSSVDSARIAQVQESIRQALAAVEERERTLPPAGAAEASALRDRVQATRERLFGLQQHARKVADKLNDVDSGLAVEERAARALLGDTAALRQKLADWTVRTGDAP